MVRGRDIRYMPLFCYITSVAGLIKWGSTYIGYFHRFSSRGCTTRSLAVFGLSRTTRSCRVMRHASLAWGSNGSKTTRTGRSSSIISTKPWYIAIYSAPSQGMTIRGRRLSTFRAPVNPICRSSKEQLSRLRTHSSMERPGMPWNCAVRVVDPKDVVVLFNLLTSGARASKEAIWTANLDRTRSSCATAKVTEA